jgi:hypothetical protein
MNVESRCCRCGVAARRVAPFISGDCVFESLHLGRKRGTRNVVGSWWGSSPIQLFLHFANANYAYSNSPASPCVYNLSCPNGNQNASCGTQVAQVIAYGVCKPYIFDKRFVVGGTCENIGKVSQQYAAQNCN